ncbi:hypothetical protein [Sandarakinorhabdus sp.]|uniref:hypothetical protein n=1 Tax=Sandarakinorhabdus sp. TaxID=1916663 RepID=UPI003563DE42
MKRRWPLLLALLPLLMGMAVYGQVWRGWAAGLETTLARWFPGSGARVGGFPYRLEAELAGVSLAHAGETRLALAAARLRLNRGPWRPELTVFQGEGIGLSAAAAGLAARVTAGSATASLKIVQDAAGLDRLARLSIVLAKARGTAGIGPDFRADSLELHGREILDAKADPANPRLPARLPNRGQLVIGAAGFALGQGAPINLAADLSVRGAGRLDGYRRWADRGGSLDAVVTGSDATGEIFKLEATIVPLGPGGSAGLRLAGTVSTVCPLAVQAALNGTAPLAEQRLRAPVRLALETALPAGGPSALSGMPGDLATRPRRGQVPACPRLG